MTEIKKITKISIFALGLASLIFGIMLVFLTDFFIANLNMPAWQNPVHPRLYGGALFVLTIFAVLVLLHKDWDWEKIKFGYELMYLLVLINLILEVSIVIIYSSTSSSEAIAEGILDIVLMCVLGVLGLYSYIKQRE